MSELLQELNKYQPDILASQPSILIDIAEAQKKQIIYIQPIQIISFAEVLHESDKIELKKVFDSASSPMLFLQNKLFKHLSLILKFL